MPGLVDIVLPEADEQGTEAVLERWLRQPGDQVRQHEPLLEINTDKAVIEVPAPASGILREVLKSANATVGTGDILGRIEAGGDSQPPRPSPEGAASIPAATASDRSPVQELSPAVRRLVRERGLDVATIK